MGFLRKNLGLGLEKLAENKHEKTIQHIYDNLENIIDFYKKLRTFYQKDIDIIHWKGNWVEKINELYKERGINYPYTEEVIEDQEQKEKRSLYRLKLEIFIERLPETPTIFDIKYLFKESLCGDLEWVCQFSIDGELISNKLKKYKQAIEYSEDYYKEYFEKTDNTTK